MQEENKNPRPEENGTLWSRVEALHPALQGTIAVVAIGLVIWFFNYFGMLGVAILALAGLLYIILRGMFGNVKSGEGASGSLTINDNRTAHYGSFSWIGMAIGLALLLVLGITIFQIGSDVIDHRSTVEVETLTYKISTSFRDHAGELGFSKLHGAVRQQYQREFEALEANYRYGKAPQNGDVGSLYDYLYLDQVLRYGLISRDSFERFMVEYHPEITDSIFTPKTHWEREWEESPEHQEHLRFMDSLNQVTRERDSSFQ